MMAIILAHLPDEYATIRSTARAAARRGILTLDDLEADIRAHYRAEIVNQKIYEFGGNDEEKKPQKEEKALTAQTSGNRRRRKGPKFDGYCDYCGKKGHQGTDCFSNPESDNFTGEVRTKTDNQQQGNTNQNNNRNNNNGNEQGRSKKGIKCYNCGKYEHIAADCRSNRNHNYHNNNPNQSHNQETSMFCGFAHKCNRVATNPLHERWLLDSGASRHMTNNVNMVQDLEPINDNVKIGDGFMLRVTHKGNVLLKIDDKHNI